ncbi:TetR/AcrR family transcriptional regulator [Sphingomonadaceae bacterium G21617-S1]|uniref:TetR/AcrR family transcriptional regulator n=1 Tax=Rhizorhabdus sp. TaxID=1968843 RepID=UPI00199022BD|nr:TetR/AcrR family transcriptional regulator [Rhizorhabdus sp.]MBD3760253.1 TetR/AcrR family transcriptional regulator [Rhizorhabdus sp.]MCZ4341003.1 TetR/AcrR family transcriptional regulator [Sphingomonadaceae bacterium G21617-S1]
MADDKPCLSRREVRRNDRRDAIVAIAQAYFLDHGYAATTMSGIAGTMGGSKATLWSYFPSKEALFEAVIDRATTLFRQRLTPLLDPDGDFESGLRGFMLRFLEKLTQAESVALHRLVHAESGRFHEVGRIFYDRGPRTIVHLAGAFIGRAMDRGTLRRDDPVWAARTLIAIGMAGSHQQLLLGLVDVVTPEMIAADADAAIDTFMRLYAPAERPA